jgi:hypothetical protein
MLAEPQGREVYRVSVQCRCGRFSGDWTGHAVQGIRKRCLLPSAVKAEHATHGNGRMEQRHEATNEIDLTAAWGGMDC